MQSPPDKTFPIIGKSKILLVDDEEIILSSVQKALKHIGYDVVAVNDALEALDLFKIASPAFDLVITDLTMPQMTGVELAKKLIEIQSDIAIILCTGYHDAMDEDEAIARGFRGLFLKPSGINELKMAINRALNL
jgi:CheY-like chemotaxis protein